ncbi:MAG: hypothetical protein ACI4QV_02560, partial [Acutalibacteraceae bacterium]
MEFYELSEKGERLYNNTYKTLIDRTLPNGYAATSLTGAYFGMFVRDSSIQAMAHLARKDTDYCKKILEYAIGYHMNIEAKSAVHIMPEVRESEIYEDKSRVYTSEQKILSCTCLGNAVQPVIEAPLFRVDNEKNYVAQEFTVPFDEIGSATVRYQMNSEIGTLTAEIRKAADTNIIASKTVAAQGKKNSFVTFEFDSPVKIAPNEKYVLVLKSDGCEFVLYGRRGGADLKAINYDKEAFGGYRKTDASLYYLIKPNLKNKGLNEKFGDLFETKEFEPDLSRFTEFSGKESVKLGLPDKTVLTAKVCLESESTDGGFEMVLKKGDAQIGRQSFSNAEIYKKPTVVTMLLGFPLFKIPDSGDYILEIRSEKKIKWYGEKSVRYFSSDIRPYSAKVQVDGNYMFVNAYAMFALGRFDCESEFISKTYDYMASLARGYISDPEYMHKNGLLRDPNYEHSRDGRYWDSYNLCTNTFASEALHKMSRLAKRMNKPQDEKFFAAHADSIARAVHKNLTCEFEGKKVYTELIALDENSKLYKGFSWVSLTPVACDWYAVDKNIMKNTFDAYFKTSCDELFGHKCLMVLCSIDENDKVTQIGNHVIGKGLAWELWYDFANGNKKRLGEITAFIDDRSADTYPEVWKTDGTISDSANQEQASWMVY